MISTDAIRAELWGSEQIQGDWEAIESKLDQSVRSSLTKRVPVIIDATHARRQWRERQLQIPNIPKNISWIGWWLQTPIEICLHWNATRRRSVPEGVILKLAAYLSDPSEQPTHHEGFDHIMLIDPAAENLDKQIDIALTHITETAWSPKQPWRRDELEQMA